ncbi:MAG: ATP-binding protein [Inhella sp.]
MADRFVPALTGAPELALDRLKVHALREDGAGRLWMASPLGLFELEPLGPQQWRPRLRSDGVAGPIWNLELDEAEGLWLAGSQGLSRLAPDRRQLQYRAGLGGRLQVGAALGASARGPDGALYFGSPGVLRVEPAALPPAPAAAPVLLADVRVFNRSLRAANAQPSLAELGVDGPLERARSLQLSHREAMVSFELRAQQFLGAERVRYAWKLNGFDRDWIEGEPGQGLATYTNLDPGRYQLWVRSAHPDGDWGEPQRLLDVAVAPPWWRSLPFRALLLALLVASVVLAWQLRVRHLRATQRRLESEVARRTAEVQAQRQQIGVLSEIGRELTANLDPQAVRQALIDHLSALLPASCFGLGLVNREEAVVEFGLVMDQGRAFRPYRRRLDAQEQPAARCVATGEPHWLRELAHDNRQVDSAQRQQDDEWLQMEDGSPPSRSRSALYVPLKIKGEVLGVLAALSPEPDAFNQTHLDMLQTLGAYAAVALDNAAAYKQLEQAQAQLVEQRKLAALGHLVAGVAHELNTPLGNGLLAASTLCEEGRRLGQTVSQGQLRKSDLNHYLQTLDGCGEVLLQSLETASRLVASFKQLAVDRSGEQRQHFSLQALVEELRTTRAQAIQQAGHRFEAELAPALALDSYPGALRQVLEQLVDNALEHGLAGRPGGCLRLRAEALGARRLRLRFSDDGQGIAPEHLGRVFDPFYTTRFGRGSNGLGLHLVYTLVSSLLGGQIRVRSEPGQGSEFEIELPLEAPR